MTYEELKKAYEESLKKCSELEKKLEDKDLEIENLTEQLLKRNQMLFGKKSERSKNLYIDGQLAIDESFLVNEAEEQSDEEAEESDAETVTENSVKKHPHRGRSLHKNLSQKEIIYRLDEDKCNCEYCNGKLRELAPEHITSRIAIIPGKVYMIKYKRMKYMCPCCDKKADKANIVSAPNNTPYL